MKRPLTKQPYRWWDHLHLAAFWLVIGLVMLAGWIALGKVTA